MEGITNSYLLENWRDNVKCAPAEYIITMVVMLTDKYWLQALLWADRSQVILDTNPTGREECISSSSKRLSSTKYYILLLPWINMLSLFFAYQNI